MNVIGVTEALDVLVASDTLGRSRTVPTGEHAVTYRVDLAASEPTVTLDLSGDNDPGTCQGL